MLFGSATQDLVAEEGSELVPRQSTKLARLVASRYRETVCVRVVDDGESSLVLLRELVDQFQRRELFRVCVATERSDSEGSFVSIS